MNKISFPLMRKLSLLIFIFSCFFVSANAQKKSAETEKEVKTVNYCEVQKNPDIYNNQTIRVRGIYEWGFEKSAFYDESCYDTQQFSETTWLWTFEPQGDCADSKTNEILKTFKSGKGDNKLEVTLVGIFNGSKGHGRFGHLNFYKYQIKVSCFEQAKLLPVEKNGCKRIDDTKPFHYISFLKTESGIAPNYKKDKKQKSEDLVWLALNNNSTCSLKVPHNSDELNGKELEDKSKIPVIYELSSRCTTKKSKSITDKTQTFSTLLPGNSIYFAVPLKYLTEQPYTITIPFAFTDRTAERFYQPFYFSQYDLPQNLRKDIDCNKF